uniref:Peptidase A2 domain-containing protein n=1 Tax=Strongyloides papillosus TaxID=174720 RepID=A0A0N5BB88_STREA
MVANKDQMIQDSNNQITDLQTQVNLQRDNLVVHESTMARLAVNAENLYKEIKEMVHEPEGTACIIKHAMGTRLNTIASEMDTRESLECSREARARATTITRSNDNATSTSSRAVNDIARSIKNVLNEVDLNEVGSEYESFITFLVGVVTTLIGRILREKMGLWLSRRRSNNNNNVIRNNPYDLTGIPVVQSPATRISSTSGRVIVNRNGVVESQINVLSTDTSPSTCSSGWTPNIDVKIKNRKYQALIDTGASLNVIAKRVVDELKLPINDHSVTVTMADGKITSTEGKVTCAVKVMKTEYVIVFNVLPENAVSGTAANVVGKWTIDSAPSFHNESKVNRRIK